MSCVAGRRRFAGARTPFASRTGPGSLLTAHLARCSQRSWPLASIASIIGQLRLLERESMADAEFATLIHAHRGYLLRVAVLQLRDSDLAEDVVQDTLVAALEGAGGFSGRSSLKTWLTGILKHKIVDAIRKKARGPII